MKLNKEETQKVALSGLLIVALLYGYFALLLGPLGRDEASIKRQTAEIQPKIDTAKKQLRRTQELEARANEVSEQLGRIESLIPTGAPIAWFPPRIAGFFERQGIEHATIRLAGDGGLDKLENFKSLQWVIDLPKVAFSKLGIAVAGLENEEPLLRINRMQIEVTRENPEEQHVILTATNIVRREK